MELKGIDVSYANGVIDWEKAKAAGLDFAIIRCGFGDDAEKQDDKQFERNVAECERLGIPWGTYIYSYALSVAQIQSEVNHTLRLLKGKKPAYPIYFDLEHLQYLKNNGGIPSRQVMTDMVKAFCTAMEAAGYYSGWYTYKSLYVNNVYADQLSKWTFWFARNITDVSAPDLPCQMWQYDTKHPWPGVPSNKCDCNIAYVDFAAFIKNAGLNGFPKLGENTLNNTITGSQTDICNAAKALFNLFGLNIKIYDPSGDILDNSDTVIGGPGATNGVPDSALNGAKRIWGADANATAQEFLKFINTRIPDVLGLKAQVADLTQKIEKAKSDLA